MISSTAVGSKRSHYLFGTGIDTDAGRKKRLVFYIWNFGMLTASAALICLITLILAKGVKADIIIVDYFRHPLIILLNFLPILLFTFLMFCLTGRAWAAVAISGALFVTAAIGNYYKLRFRSDPFMFSDLTAIQTALGVSSNYDLTLGKRVIFCAAAVVIAAVFMFFFVKGRCSGKTRAITAAVIIISLFPLWEFVYSSNYIYSSGTNNYEHLNRWIASDEFISKGFVYPFIHSAVSAFDAQPDGYDKDEAEQSLSQFSDSDIPDGKKVNILAFQLEAFSDFTTLGIDGIDEIYADYHKLEAESYTGSLVTNILGGGTINTERGFLTGYADYRDYRKNTNSYVWYLRQQGYTANGIHPCYRSFYNRLNTNQYLGFENYLYYEDFYEKFGDVFLPDSVLFPTVLEQFRQDIEAGDPVFSFNVSYQGHGPYSVDKLDWDEPVWDADVSDYTYYVVNNYLSSVKDTISNLCRLKDELLQMSEPVVLVVCGDHKPWLGDNSSCYTELGINLDSSTPDGFMNYYSTRYLIWANDAAKALIGCDFIGEGPVISPCYLMNELFSLLGWDGPGYMKFMDDLRTELPVINSSGFYITAGEITDTLSPRLQSREDLRKCIQYYVRNNFFYSEVAS